MTIGKNSDSHSGFHGNIQIHTCSLRMTLRLTLETLGLYLDSLSVLKFTQDGSRTILRYTLEVQWVPPDWGFQGYT